MVHSKKRSSQNLVLTSGNFPSAKITYDCAWMSANPGAAGQHFNLKVANKVMKESHKRELQTKSSKRKKKWFYYDEIYAPRTRIGNSQALAIFRVIWWILNFSSSGRFYLPGSTHQLLFILQKTSGLLAKRKTQDHLNFATVGNCNPPHHSVWYYFCKCWL